MIGFQLAAAFRMSFIGLAFSILVWGGFPQFSQAADLTVVPYGINFSGVLSDSFGSRITSPIDARFILSVGSTGSNSQVVWCGEYTALTPGSDGTVIAVLGKNDAAQGSIALNGTPACTPGGSIELTPKALSAVNSSSSVSLSVQLNNGSGWETLAPSFKMNSSLFAYRSESLGGYTAAAFPKFDSSPATLGAILSQNGTPVVDVNGNWIGGGTGSFSSLKVTTTPLVSDDAVNKTYSDTRLAGHSVVGTASSGKILSFDGTNWVYVSPSSATGSSTSTANSLVQRDASGNFSAGVVSATPKIPSSLLSAPSAGAFEFDGTKLYFDDATPLRRIVPILNGSPANGQTLTWDSANQIWQPTSLAGGSVTSVALSLPGMFSVSGSPITGSGTLAATLASQASSTILAAPSGSAGAPTFRALVAGDLPNLDASKITSGTLSQDTSGTAANVTGTVTYDHGGTGSTAAPTAGGMVYGTGTAMATSAVGTAGQVLVSNAAGTPSFRSLSTSNLSLTASASGISISTPQDVATTASPSFAGLTVGTLTNTELSYVHGVTSSIQAQLDAKGSGSLGSLNTLTGASQTFAAGSAGSDFGISSSGSTHTFSLPDASSTARGVVTTGAQTLAGVKTFSSAAVFSLAPTVSAFGTAGYVKNSAAGALSSSASVPISDLGSVGSNDVALVSDGSGKISASAVGSTRLGYLPSSAPTAGGVAYGTGSALATSVAGTSGQVLTSGGSGAPTWTTPSSTDSTKLPLAGGSMTGGIDMGAQAITNAPTITGSSASAGTMTLRGTSHSTPGSLLLNPSGGNVGIGTSGPVDALTAYSSAANAYIHAGGFSGGYMGIAFNTSSSAALSTTNYSILGNGANTYINRPSGGGPIP